MQDLSRGPPQPTPLRVADGSLARTTSTPEEVAHIVSPSLLRTTL